MVTLVLVETVVGGENVWVMSEDDTAHLGGPTPDLQ